MIRIRIKQFAIVLLACVLAFLCAVDLLCRRDENRESGAVRINEICRNFSIAACEDGTYRDYIELYNAGTDVICLDGYRLAESDHVFSLDGITIEADAYQIIYLAKKKDKGNAAYADLTIAKNGDSTLALLDSRGRMVDSVTVPELRYNTSYVREAEGSDSWCIAVPSMGETNDSREKIAAEALEEPVFSAESGFYNTPFWLYIRKRGEGNIYYTLDGSEPTTDSLLYREPVWIADVSDHVNTYAGRTDTSLGYAFGTEEQFAAPTGSVDKAVVVRAAVYDDTGMRKSGTVTGTYFIGFADKGYADLPVMSVVTDPAHLFDYETGIYVAGKTFGTYAANGLAHPDNWMRWEGNFMCRGREWERPAHIDYFTGDRHLVLSEEIGVRIKGGATRAYAQKSLNLFARDIYGGSDTFQVPFFGETGSCAVTLFAGANDYKIKIRDVLIHNVCGDLEFATMRNTPCYMFLDGEYWGIYHLTEKFGDSYIAEHYHVPEDDVIMVKSGLLECGGETDYWKFQDLQDMAETADFSQAADYETLCETIDMQSFLDYYGTQIYIARCGDWPDMNEALWRSRSITEHTRQDGRWRWMLFDLNFSEGGLSEHLADMDTFQYVRDTCPLFDNAMNNPQFREAFVLNFCDLTNTCLSNDTVLPELERLAELMKEPMLQEYGRFYGDTWTETDYDAEVMDLYRFFLKRYDFIMAYMKQDFGLQGTLQPVRIVAPRDADVHIFVNEKEITIRDGAWTGYYFTDYPVSVRAASGKEGRFNGWQGDVVSAEAEIVVNVTEGGVTLSADIIS